MNDKVAVASWADIYSGLKSLFDMPVETDHIGKMAVTQRLNYEDFESILYNLMLKIDPPACRRTFRTIYPAKYKPDRDRFFEGSASLINSKQIFSQRIVANHLKVLGGEQFRKILSTLIKTCLDLETDAIQKQLPPEINQRKFSNIDQLQDAIEEVQAELKGKIDNLRSSATKFKQMKNDSNEERQTLETKWRAFCRELPGASQTFDRNQTKKLYRLLLSRLEKANGLFKVSFERIAAMPPPPEILDKDPMDRPKRLSQSIKKLRECLEPSPDKSVGISQTELARRIPIKFDELDDRMMGVLLELKEKKDQADDDFLKRPEIKERYEYYKKIVPFIDIKPIGHSSYLESAAPSIEEVEKIIHRYMR